MKLFTALMIMLIGSGLMVLINTASISNQQKYIEKQQQQINQLTERVILLENALADKSGVKK